MDFSIKTVIAHRTYLRVSGYNFQNIMYYFDQRFFFTFSNSVDPGEMQHYVAFSVSVFSLFGKVLARGFPNIKR